MSAEDAWRIEAEDGRVQPLGSIPSHMVSAVRDWVILAEPHPHEMGGFFRAVLSNDFAGAATKADWQNRDHLYNWAILLYNVLPSPAWGSMEKMLAWYDLHHPRVVAEASP